MMRSTVEMSTFHCGIWLFVCSLIGFSSCYEKSFSERRFTARYDTCNDRGTFVLDLANDDGDCQVSTLTTRALSGTQLQQLSPIYYYSTSDQLIGVYCRFSVDRLAVRNFTVWRIEVSAQRVIKMNQVIRFWIFKFNLFDFLIWLVPV